MKTPTKPKTKNLARRLSTSSRSTRVVSREDRVLDLPLKVPLELGFVSRAQTFAFVLSCLSILVSPYLFSGFWPVTRDYGTQSFFSVLAACAALLLALSPRNEAQPSLKNWPLASHLLIAFFAWCALSCVASVYWHDTILEIARIGTGAAWFLILRELLRFGVATTDNRVLDSRALCLMLAAFCGLAIVCVLSLLDFLRTHNPRQFGTFFNPNLFATACAMTLPLSLGATLSAWRWARRERPSLTVFVVAMGTLLSLLILGGLIVTSSKGGFLAALVALMVFAFGLWRAQSLNLKKVWRANNLLIFAALLLVLVVGGALATKTILPRLRQAGGSDDNSTMFRVYTWKSTVKMAQARPIFGWGAGGFAQAHDQFATVGTTKSAHQSWLQIAAEQGFPALILLAAATFAFLLRGWRALKTSHWPQSLGALGAIVAFAVHGLTDAGWSVSSVVFLLMLAFALLDATGEPNAPIKYSNREENAREASSRLRWGWLALVLLTGAFSWSAQRAANGEDARTASEKMARQGQLAPALETAQDALDADPLAYNLWLHIANLRLANGEASLAESAFAHATQLNPRNPVPWRAWANSRGNAHQSSTGNSVYSTTNRVYSTEAFGEALWDNAVRCAPHDSSLLLSRAKWRLSQNPNDAQAWNDLEIVVGERDAPYGRYAAVGDYVNLDFARASVLLAQRDLKNGDKNRVQALVKNALSDVALAQGKVAQQKEVAAANADSDTNLGPPKDLDELRNQLKALQASE